MNLRLMEVGYNLVERKLIGKKFEEIEEKMSIIEFLRRLNRKEGINRKIAVIGFEEVLLSGEGMARYVRQILVRSVNMLRNHIIQIIVDGELVLDREPKIRYKGKEVSLILIFGNRLKPKEVGYFYSPPNI